MTKQFVEKTDVLENSNSTRTQHFKKISFQKKIQIFNKKIQKKSDFSNVKLNFIFVN